MMLPFSMGVLEGGERVTVVKEEGGGALDS